MSRSSQTSATPWSDLHTLRREAMAHALAHPLDLSDTVNAERGQMFFRRLRMAVEFAGWCALEYNDAAGPFAGDARLLEHILPNLEAITPEFRDDGTVAGGDVNTAYFALVPATEALALRRGWSMPNVINGWSSNARSCLTTAWHISTARWSI